MAGIICVTKGKETEKRTQSQEKVCVCVWDREREGSHEKQNSWV